MMTIIMGRNSESFDVRIYYLISKAMVGCALSRVESHFCDGSDPHLDHSLIDWLCLNLQLN